MSDFTVQAGYTERRPSRGAPILHAVSVESQLSGLVKPDAECGRLINEFLGTWGEVDGPHCKRCLSALAKLDKELEAA